MFNVFIYNSNGEVVGNVVIHGDRLKKFNYTHKDYSLESFVFKKHEHLFNEKIDFKYTIDSISSFSNEGGRKLTHRLICAELGYDFFLKLSLPKSIQVKWYTKQLYLRTTLFKREVLMVVITALATILLEIFMIKLWKWL